MSVASRILRIQRGEGRVTTLVVALMGISMAGIAVGDSGVSALFFDRIGTDALPLVYLLQGVITFGVMLALTGVLGRLGPRRAYLAAPLGLATLVAIERAIVATDVDWIYPTLWITVAIATLVQGVFLWGVAGAVVDIRQAKRLFPIFGAGGILGSVLGGLLTGPLAPAIGAQNLLFVWAGALAAAFVLARMLLGGAVVARGRPSRRRTSAIRDATGALTYVRRSGLLVWMTLAALLFSILFFSLFLPFAGAATERFPDADQLAGFLGLFWAALTAAAFVVSMLLTNRLFAWVGVAAAVIVLPLLYSVAFGILLFGSGFAMLVALRFTVGTWLQGVASPGWETLANVVPESRRDQVRAFLNGGPTQMGTVVAGLIALVGQDVLTARQFAAIGLIAAVATIVATLGIRRSYTAALVDALRAGRPQVFEGAPRRTPTPIVLDADSARALARSVRSPDLHERRLAFQLLADLPPEARPPEVLDGVEDQDPIVRLAATRCLDVGSADGLEALRSLLDDADPSVAAAAAALALATMEGESAGLRLHGLLTDRDGRIRLAAAEQLVSAPASAAADFGSRLLSDPLPEIRAIALERVADGAPDQTLEPALRALHDPDALVRVAAGRALGAADGPALPHMLDALVDPATADAAIEAIRRAATGGDADRDRIRSFVSTLAEGAVRDRDVAAAIPPDGEATALLRDATLDRGRRLARSALWAATILGPRRAEMETAIENLDGTPGQVANALETLESAGDATLVRPLVSLWEPVSAPDRTLDWLAAALDDEDELIRRCAELVRSRDEGGTMERSVTALSVMERVLFLRKVPLFADLSPADLERVAGLAEDHGYASAEVIAAEGEAGEELHIVVEGTIRVIRGADGNEHELARRTTGDVVGEMSIVTQEPRMATLVAEGDVRTVTLGHREFESMLRERPSIALAVMRVLAHRIAEDSRSSDL